MFQENLSGWTIRLDTRANSASFAAETTRCQYYVQGLIEQLSRISMLLRLLAESERGWMTLGSKGVLTSRELDSRTSCRLGRRRGVQD